MSKRIQIGFTCSLCDCENHIRPIKPNHFQPTFMTASCEVCDSIFKLKFTTIKGKPGFTQVDSLDVKASPAGLDMFRERTKPAGNSAPEAKEVTNAT